MLGESPRRGDIGELRPRLRELRSRAAGFDPVRDPDLETALDDVIRPGERVHGLRQELRLPVIAA